MQIKKFRHICIVVQDMEKMIEFYNKVLGLNIILHQTYTCNDIGVGVGVKSGNIETCLMGIDDIIEIELTSYDSNHTQHIKYNASDIGYRHMAFIVDDIARAHKEMISNNISCISAPIYIKRKDGKKVKFFYCLDPEGNIIELNQFL